MNPASSGGAGFEYPDDPFDAEELVTNDAVGGEPVVPNGHYAGPEGSEPREVSPVLYEHAADEHDSPEAIDME